jgi:hypothetical protein
MLRGPVSVDGLTSVPLYRVWALGEIPHDTCRKRTMALYESRMVPAEYVHTPNKAPQTLPDAFLPRHDTIIVLTIEGPQTAFCAILWHARPQHASTGDHAQQTGDHGHASDRADRRRQTASADSRPQTSAQHGMAGAWQHGHSMAWPDVAQNSVPVLTNVRT